MTESQQLLAEYTKSGSDAAFRELVNRYVDLVYSTALRLVEGDTHRAQDVSQSVFLDLARKARALPADVSLGGWLHRNSCLVAGHVMRGERRRQNRERQAVEMNALQSHPEADFSQVAPILDEAINELGEVDRTAILLRFFEQHDFRTVGLALGSNEDAARMRVTRALEKLATLLKRRGVTASFVTLGVALGANAVQAAPAGLATTISTAAATLAGTGIAATATATVTKTIAMTTLQKTIITATVAVLAGAGIYEARQASTARAETETLRQQQAPLNKQIQQLSQAFTDSTNWVAALRADNERLSHNGAELLKLRGQVAQLRNEAQRKDRTDATAASMEIAAKSWLNRVDQLKEFLEQNPKDKIPELQFLLDWQWLSAVSNGGTENNDYTTRSDYEMAVERLRGNAETEFAKRVQAGLKDYFTVNTDHIPVDLLELQQYWDPEVRDILVQFYEIKPKSSLPKSAIGNLTIKADWFITRKQPVNQNSKSRLAIFPFNRILWSSIQ